MQRSSVFSSRFLHWTITLAVLGALITGYATTRSDPFYPTLFRTHLALGAVAGWLTLLRLILWLYRGAPDRVFPVTSRIQGLASDLVHGCLRVLPLILLVSGVGMISISGAIGPILDGTMSDLSQLATVPPRKLHHATALLLGILIALHAAAAAWHVFRRPLHGT